ncbi:hypothetical protein L1077_26605 [Pseudoalteromonas luteoviolacea]|uniref:hypothetical protein n=1 Tax=Pseudoalteromonas luteoviolacea TaxID=43657 RepID=UPI001F3CA23F|nr:hypothetical protein [Pseudoalteromonas luteoviolacea]MCF6443000.1 hypothetical protein [Pseudoalteromonas luteoviolacea]
MKLTTLLVAASLAFSSLSVKAATDTSAYRFQAYFDNVLNSRCAAKPSESNAISRIDWALRQRVITNNAANWGKQFKYYPIVDFFDSSIAVICSYQVAPSSTMTLERFKRLADSFNMHTRCVVSPDINEIYARIDSIVNDGYITNDAGLWARYNGYLPIVDLFADRVIGACPFRR